MRHGSLESGIGMFDYAAEKMGWGNIFHCEINPFCRTVLNYYWPKAKSYANVFGFNGYEWRGKIDVISAGFPCQPFSVAGKREGSSDDRFIWPENMRIFREARPTFIVCENVPGLLTIENGMVFEQVCADLKNEGYEVQTYIIPACATDKDHRRDRLWIVAYSHSNGQRRRKLGEHTEEKTGSESKRHQRERIWSKPNGENSNDTNTSRQRLEGRMRKRIEPVQLDRGKSGERENWLEAATRLCILDDGNAGRLDTTAISKRKWRIESLKAAGNTIVWEIAYQIFNAIEQSLKSC